MDAVKSVVGLGKKEDAGEEPVSGEQGEGTTAAPFDSGNSKEAQESAKESAEQQDSKEGATDENKAPTSGGGSWLKAVNPFGGGKKKEAETSDTSTTAQQTESVAQQDESKLPANHLGLNVPAGHSLDFAPPQAPEPTSTDTKKMAENDADRSIASASTDAKDSGFGQPGQLSPDWQTKNPGPKQQQLRGSRASMSAPSGQRVFNPAGQGRIPTAGGQPVGARAAEDRRRRSVWSSTDEGNIPPLDKQGSPDPVTQENTLANTLPQSDNGEGSSKAAAEQATAGAAAPAPPSDAPAPEVKPDFQTFQWGEGGEGAAPAGNAAVAGGTKEAEGVNGNKSSTVEQAVKVKEKAKEAVPIPSSSGQKKERRGSRLEAFKGKLGFGKKD